MTEERVSDFLVTFNGRPLSSLPPAVLAFYTLFGRVKGVAAKDPFMIHVTFEDRPPLVMEFSEPCAGRLFPQ